LPALSLSRTKLLRITAAVILAGGAVLLANLASAAPNPPGNNGTVKIDDVPFDDAPNNEPHVGCVFEVDFYGYDQGNLNADVTFESHPPTGPIQVLLTDTLFIGEDDNSGGGSEAGLDASREYTLDFTGIEPHPNQGFHVKLTVHADGSQGADTKHKVFWTTGCGGVSPTTTTTTLPEETTTTTSTTLPEETTTTTSTTLPEETTTTTSTTLPEETTTTTLPEETTTTTIS